MYKFRAWDKGKRQMYPNYGVIKTIEFGQNSEIHSIVVAEYVQINEDGDCDWDIFEVKGERIELMQYTGLKDKNGTEIYEGDIIEQRLLPTKRMIYKFTVLWSQEKAAFVIDGDCSTGQKHLLSDYCQSPPYEVEVISNIYEYKEG